MRKKNKKWFHKPGEFKMEKMKIREFMVPIDEFPRISNNASFYEAFMALEDAQKKYLEGKNRQRILLVEDDNGRVVGKISPIDMIRGLEPKFTQVEVEENLVRFGVSYALKSMQEEVRLWQTPFSDLCRKAKDVRIKDFTKDSPEKQAVNIDDRLIKAFNWFVMGRYDSLFVYEGNEIVGLLRFSDVYKKIKETMKECGLDL
jgi:predicted transcriptional regulator